MYGNTEESTSIIVPYEEISTEELIEKAKFWMEEENVEPEIRTQFIEEIALTLSSRIIAQTDKEFNMAFYTRYGIIGGLGIYSVISYSRTKQKTPTFFQALAGLGSIYGLVKMNDKSMLDDIYFEILEKNIAKYPEYLHPYFILTTSS